jgi:SOS-response transcriptional repressor LexA
MTGRVDGEHKRLIAEWVAAGLRKPGKTQTGLASAMGITQPQIYRILNAERSLRADEIGRVENYLDERFPYRQISRLEQSSSDLTVGSMPVLGRVQAGVFMEGGDSDDVIGTIPFGRDPSYPAHRRQYAVLVVGDSMDKVLPEGSYAVVMAADGQTPAHGDLVIVRRTQRGLVERTIKRFRETPQGGVLLPDSTNPRHVPIPVAGDSETVIEVEAFVIGRYEKLGR